MKKTGCAAFRDRLAGGGFCPTVGGFAGSVYCVLVNVVSMSGRIIGLGKGALGGVVCVCPWRPRRNLLVRIYTYINAYGVAIKMRSVYRELSKIE